MILVPFSIENCLFSCWLCSTALPSDLLPLPLNLTYILISSFDAVTSEPGLYKLLTFQVQNLTSIFLRLGLLPKESVQILSLLLSFVTVSLLLFLSVSCAVCQCFKTLFSVLNTCHFKIFKILKTTTCFGLNWPSSSANTCF
jgi:hypothetical protein